MVAPAPTPLYRALRMSARVSLGLFYRHIEVTGLEHLEQLEHGVPTILASTHPNSIVDPLLVGLFEQRPVTFCARDGLFRVPVFGALLRSVGAVPIRRRSDHAASAVDNDDAFAACRAVLAGGGVISIFPEGKTHARMRVEPIKTGVARIAIDAERSAGPLDVHIVPVGLNYLVREAFRSDVHVAFGPPIRVAALLDPATDPATLVRALTERVGESMRALAVHVEREEDERLIAQVTAIIVGIRDAEGLDGEGQSPAERTALARRVIDAYRWLEDHDPIRCARLRTRVIRYLDERRSLGYGGVETALQGRRERRHGREDRSILGPVALLLGAPLAALGVATSILPFLIVRLLLLIGRPTTYRIALTKLLGGMVLYGVWFALLTWSVLRAVGPGAALGVGLALMPLTVFTHRYLIDLRLYRFGLRKNLRRVVQRRRFARLRVERDRLTQELAQLRQTYLGSQ
ncbi:lysophospholipid acyltransferase family protein [Enhygromyxa salina]|nr:lysophospholipid acyltransferase family protein [Enhygromyxa salina]